MLMQADAASLMRFPPIRKLLASQFLASRNRALIRGKGPYNFQEPTDVHPADNATQG
jgi:hypothetical protein